MEKKNRDVRLKQGAVVFSDGRGYGMKRGKDFRYAKDAVQTAVLKALKQRRGTLEELLDAVTGQMPGDPQQCMTSLALAEFVLDFGEYLEQ